MKKEINKGQNWRKGYQAGFEEGVKETEKAFGGCKKCYGKGYGTSLEFTEGSEDFGGEDTSRHQLPIMRFCSCGRGKQLEEIISKEK